MLTGASANHCAKQVSHELHRKRVQPCAIVCPHLSDICISNGAPQRTDCTCADPLILASFRPQDQFSVVALCGELGDLLSVQAEADIDKGNVKQRGQKTGDQGTPDAQIPAERPHFTKVHICGGRTNESTICRSKAGASTQLFEDEHGEHDDEDELEHVGEKQQKRKVLAGQGEQGERGDEHARDLEEQVDEGKARNGFEDQLPQTDGHIDQTEQNQRTTRVHQVAHEQRIADQRGEEHFGESRAAARQTHNRT